MSLDQAGRVIPELDHWDTATWREQVLGYRMEHLELERKFSSFA